MFQKNNSPKKPIKKTKIKKLTPLDKVLNEEMKILNQMKSQIVLSQVCQKKNPSSLKRYK